MSLQSQIDILALGLCNIHKAIKKGDPVGGFCITNESGEPEYYIDSKGQIFEQGSDVTSGTEVSETANKVRLIANDGLYDDNDKMIDFEFTIDDGSGTDIQQNVCTISNDNKIVIDIPEQQ